MFVACGIWCLADVSSVSPSSEQTGELFMHTGTCSCIHNFLLIANEKTNQDIKPLSIVVYLCILK